uniref:Uncharacterized protein n=1 Tax=Romanomermis culicivorax TaxID=13658 RepID=A0A915IXY8_ROMCU
MWRCLRFEKRKHALEKPWLGRRCHFDGPILATGSGYDSGIMRVVVCGSQSSSWLWCSRLPQLDDDGIVAAYNGFQPGATEWGFLWGPKQKSMQNQKQGKHKKSQGWAEPPEVLGRCRTLASSLNASSAGHGMNSFKCVMDTVCGQPGAS